MVGCLGPGASGFAMWIDSPAKKLRLLGLGQRRLPRHFHRLHKRSWNGTCTEETGGLSALFDCFPVTSRQEGILSRHKDVFKSVDTACS
jgi:hypothetical protein